MRFLCCAAAGLALAGCYDDSSYTTASIGAPPTDECVPVDDDAVVGDYGVNQAGFQCVLEPADLEDVPPTPSVEDADRTTDDDDTGEVGGSVKHPPRVEEHEDYQGVGP